MLLNQLETPALLLDEARMTRNIERMRAQMQRLGVAFRPHVKTNKCLEVSRRLMETPQGPITISTLLEAEQLATRLREIGIACPVVSVGSTPTALFAQRLVTSPKEFR